MGYSSAVGMAGATDLRTALGWHLQSNHFPPVPTEMRVGGSCCNAFRFQGMTESAAVRAARPQSTSSPRPRLDFVNHRGE